MPEINHAFMSLHFPIIHPTGADGWHAGLPLRDVPYIEANYPLPVARRAERAEPNDGQTPNQDGQPRNGRGARHRDGDGAQNRDGDGLSDDEGEDEGNGGDDLDDPDAKTVTFLRLIRFHLHKRPGDFSILLHAGKLFQEYVVDTYAQIEWCRLRYLRDNQLKLRAHTYRAVVEAAQNNVEANNIGKQSVVLPSTFIGSDRQMTQLYQDAMAIVRRLGNPSYFITMTCNPNWPEILAALGPHETPQNRPDLVARVFNMKLRDLLHDLHSRDLFGEIVARVHVIEFQKRGLPHAHILITVAPEYRPRTPQDIDDIISADIPDPVADPELYETVTTCMLHGHCSPQNKCHKPGSERCEKKFPHPFRESTSIEGEGYPQYRRRNNGRTVTKRVNNQMKVFDNRHVVPYNPGFSRKYNCHINVEATTGVAAIKYIHKYLYKGGDRAMIQVRIAISYRRHT
jgi:hypothetical protein